MLDNTIRNDIESKDIQFQQLFTQFQSNLRKNPNYIKHDAFKDLKIIFKLYSETSHLKGFNYNHLKVSDIEKLLIEFNDFQKKELINYLIKSLAKEGLEEKAKEILTLLARLEIKCAWEELLNKKNIHINFLKLLYYLTSYNTLTLLLTPIVYVLLLSIICLDAPCHWMEIIHFNKKHITNEHFTNHFLNVLLYVFDLDYKVEVNSLNSRGVFLMIALKSFTIIVVLNFLIKEFFNRIKLK